MLVVQTKIKHMFRAVGEAAVKTHPRGHDRGGERWSGKDRRRGERREAGADPPETGAAAAVWSGSARRRLGRGGATVDGRDRRSSSGGRHAREPSGGGRARAGSDWAEAGSGGGGRARCGCALCACASLSLAHSGAREDEVGLGSIVNSQIFYIYKKSQIFWVCHGTPGTPSRSAHGGKGVVAPSQYIYICMLSYPIPPSLI